MMNGNRIWVETNDFIRYFDGSVTPTGIGRVQAEIFRSLRENHCDRISFFRIGRSSEEVEILEYAALMRRADTNSFLRLYGRNALLLPVFKLLRFLKRQVTAAARRRLNAGAERRRFFSTVRPGDVIVNLGASWSHRDYGPSIRELKQRCGLRFVLVLHDLLPVTHPDLVTPGEAPRFELWFRDMARTWDLVLTPSSSTAAAARQFIDSNSLPMPPIRVIPFGGGFSTTRAAQGDVPLYRRIHVLYVSTIEIRKNHLLLFRIWERLLRKHGPDAVPDLVFAGKFGWEIQELQSALKASRYLDGKIRIVHNLSDDALADHYRASLFTVFPSFAEGWGLPVTESLYHGRYCIASNTTSLPEAGGRFADYHDPSDHELAFRLIERAIFDRGFLAEKERTIHEEYTPPSWKAAGDAIVDAIDGELRRSGQPAIP